MFEGSGGSGGAYEGDGAGVVWSEDGEGLFYGYFLHLLFCFTPALKGAKKGLGFLAFFLKDWLDECDDGSDGFDDAGYFFVDAEGVYWGEGDGTILFFYGGGFAAYADDGDDLTF